MIMTSLKCYTVDDPKIQKCHFSKKYDQSNTVVICSKTAILLQFLLLVLTVTKKFMTCEFQIFQTNTEGEARMPVKFH